MKLLLYCALVCCLQAQAQVTCDNAELRNISSVSFNSHPYKKQLRSVAVPKHNAISWKSVDDGVCYFETQTILCYKKERTEVCFADSSATSPKCKLQYIRLLDRRSPFITKDGIRVGDKILLSKICMDIPAFKEASLNGYYPEEINFITYKNTIYRFKEIKTGEICAGTTLKITEITITPAKN